MRWFATVQIKLTLFTLLTCCADGHVRAALSMGATGDSQLRHGIPAGTESFWLQTLTPKGMEFELPWVLRGSSAQLPAGILAALPSESAGDHLASSSRHSRPPYCSCILLHYNLLWMVPSLKQRDSLRETRVHINKFLPTLP